jgi:hypothetical protein
MHSFDILYSIFSFYKASLKFITNHAMSISSHITIAFKPEFYKSKQQMDALEPGTILKLKIIELKGDRALIEFGNFRSTAEIKIPVSLGEELTVRVLEAGKQLKLGVVTAGSKDFIAADSSGQRLEAVPNENLTKFYNDVARVLKPALDTTGHPKVPTSIFNVLARLNAYFEPFELKDMIAQLLPRLRSHFEDSGIFFEKSLEQIISKVLADERGGSGTHLADLAEVKAVFNRDLKPNLVLLQHFIAEKETLSKIFGPKVLSVLQSAVDALLSDINQQQGRAVRQQESADPFQVFSFTLPIKDREQTARLKVFYEKKQKSGPKKGFQISLLLSLGHIGDVRTDFFLVEKDLNINFFVTEPLTKVKIQDNFQELDDLLGGLFDHIHLKVHVSAQRVRDFDRAEIQMAGNQQVDIRI